MMTVAKLIEALQKLPPNLPVYRRDGSGCEHCNENGIDYYTGVTSIDSGNFPVDGYRQPFKDAVII